MIVDGERVPQLNIGNRVLVLVETFRSIYFLIVYRNLHFSSTQKLSIILRIKHAFNQMLAILPCTPRRLVRFYVGTVFVECKLPYQSEEASLRAVFSTLFTGR